MTVSRPQLPHAFLSILPVPDHEDSRTKQIGVRGGLVQGRRLNPVPQNPLNSKNYCLGGIHIRHHGHVKPAMRSENCNPSLHSTHEFLAFTFVHSLFLLLLLLYGANLILRNLLYTFWVKCLLCSKSQRNFDSSAGQHEELNQKPSTLHGFNLILMRF